ncbi:hypothetical protein PSHT_04881 [Puccinia striiformis]|uniref:FAD-binding domain-containing protein n=1 Tax=Puccinia striiformis TaxID=27350 RepID=A0A2S4WBX4_9BASI|nr:hypothetical protein PSHT_04881 [Puccinia striiformis]
MRYWPTSSANSIRTMNVLTQLRSIAPSRHALGRSKARCLQVRSLTNTGTVRNIGNDRSPADTHGVENYDVVIVGGGVVGLTLANAFASCRTLQQAGYRVAVLEASDLTKLRDWSLPSGQWSNRVSSITNENLDFLKQIGAWQYIDQSRTNPVERMQVWDGLSDARIVFDSLDGCTTIGGTNRRDPSDGPLRRERSSAKSSAQNLDKRALVDLYGSTKVASISPDEANWPLIKTEDGQCLKAPRGWNYNAHCVVGTLELEPTMYNWTAWQRFLTAGPLGFLPLSDRHASLAWSTLPHIATGLKALDSQTLASAINACFRLPHESVAYLLERIRGPFGHHAAELGRDPSGIDWRSSPSVHAGDTVSSGEAPTEDYSQLPLRMFHADQYLGTSAGSDHSSSLENTSQPTRTVLVGDAAHVLHPMAGQGLNLGLGDARELAKTVRIAIENGQDIGGLTALAPYARSRYLANHLVMATVDKLNKLYSLETPPIVWVRSVGVEVLNELPGLKAAMMGSAGGTPGTASSNGPWPAIATAYETAQKARVIVEGLGSIAAGAIVSTIHRATAPKI